MSFLRRFGWGLALAALFCGCSRDDGERGFSTLSELEATGALVGVEEGTCAERLANERLKGCRFLQTIGPTVLYPALESGRIDAIAYDRPALEYATLRHPEFRLLDENLGTGCVVIGTRLGNEALMTRVNAFIRRIREDGTYREMYDRWVRTRHPKMPEIPEPAHPDGEITVGVCLEQEPMAFVADGMPCGYDIEFARRLALFLDRRPVLTSLNYESLLAAVPAGKYDLGIAQFDATPERRNAMLMSEPYIDTPIGIMVRRGRTGRRSFLGFVRDGLRGTFLEEKRWRLVAGGLLVTVEITLFSALLGTLLAFPLWLALAGRNPLMRLAGRGWVEAMQGTPALVLLMIVFYVAFARVDVSPVLVAVIVFGMSFSAYAGEMLRVGVEAVGVGQREAAFMLGYSRFGAFRRVILPQVVLRMLPVYRGNVISLLKDTAVVGYITIHDLTKVSDIIRARTYEAFFPLVSTAVLYFLLAKLLERGLAWVGSRIDPLSRRKRRGEEAAA